MTLSPSCLISGAVPGCRSSSFFAAMLPEVCKVFASTKGSQFIVFSLVPSWKSPYRRLIFSQMETDVCWNPSPCGPSEWAGLMQVPLTGCPCVGSGNKEDSHGHGY